MSEQLKPCPFCGSDEASLLLPTCTKDSKYNPADRAFPSVFCIGCFVSVPGRDWDRSGDSAIAAWNRRAEPVRETGHAVQEEPVAWIRKNGFRFVAEIEPQDDSEVPLYAAPVATWNRRAEPEQHPCCWAPSKALKELERGMNNSPCILTDAPAEFNDTPLYRDPAGTIAAQQQILNRLAEVLGMKAGDTDGLITRAMRVRKDAERYQWLKDKRVFRVYSVDMSGKHTYITAGRPIGSGRNIDEAIDAEIDKPLAGEEADKPLEVTSQPAGESREWGTVPYACDWVRTDRHSGRGGWK